ncbi:uncharacterized protein [Eleutherodactylus coqui]|uniref:uncharacterized protein isoform X2 n=1 Tax=Eleutherodactylus coqui TaxID=57060 RepID=UPI0034635EA2
MRKPQPFTIGTRLSIPKCPDLSLPSGGADGASESRNVSDRVSHYLLQVPPPSPPRRAAHSRSPVACLTDRDHLSSGSPVRSITKITLSRQAEGAALREGTAATSSRPLAKTSHGNCNNNNSRGLRPVLPDAADFPHDWSVTDPRMIIGAAECHTTAKCPGPLSDFTLSDAVRTAPSAGSPLIRSERASSDNIARLSREIQQAESWVRCKVQDLTDGGAVCPNLIHRDIQAFEGTVIKLSQMVGHMSRTHPAAAASVHSQLQTLRVQWQLLKQKAVIENCAVGGATTLLEFNKKADELEIWMREKEEIPPLHVLLDESNDKVQITRRILDLKQEQIHYCTLQENINSLAQKLEKQGRPESRAASTRRKHLNRMWLRLQTSLHEHHQSLQLALEAASLWHQADTILRAIEEKSCCTWVKSRDDGRGDQDLRDIASQIMMLDVTVSQVSNLHPLLSSRALHKHRQVKEGWARLQHTLRSEKTSRTAPSTIPTREPGDCLTSGTPEHSSVGNQEQSLLGSGGPQTEKMNSGPQRQTRSPDGGLRSPEPTRSLTSEPETGHRPHGPSETPEVRHLLQDLTSTTQWLQDVELLLSEPAAMRSPELIRKDLKQVSLLEREVRSRGSALQCLRGKAKRCRKPNWAVTEEMEVKVKVQEVEERFQTLQDALRRRVSDLRDTLVLSEFMKVVQMEEERKKKETIATRGTARGDPHGPAAGRTQSFTPLEELQEAVEMLNDAVKERERALAVSREAAELESRVLALSQMMVATRAKLLDVRSQLEEVEEEFVAVRSETDLRDLQGVFSQQQQVETDMSGRIGMEVRKLQEQKEQLQDLCPNRSLSAGRSIEDALRTWADLQTLIQENQARLQKTERLREFFLRYLGMISWTEVTRGQILSESPRGRLSPAQREELERMMEGKLKDFEALAGIGWKLIGEDHLLAQMIRQRLEEVQGLLSWLLMRWRCQKRQRIMGNQTQKSITSEADDYMDAPKVTPSSGAFEEFECPEDEDATLRPAPRGPILRKYRRRALSPILYQPPPGRPPVGTDMVEGVHMPEDCSRKCAKGPLWLEPKNPPTESASPEPQEEAVMVSTYLNTKEETQNKYQSLTVPRLSKTTLSSEHNLFPSCESSSDVSPKIRSNISLKSLRRKEKAQRSTIQEIMGLCTDTKPNTKDTPIYQSSTWPPKQQMKFTTSGRNTELETFLNYVENPLSKDIDAECGSGSKKPVLKTLSASPQAMSSSCPRLTVGSVLTLQISKEPHVLDNIQDAITVISMDDSGDAQEKPTADQMEVTEEHSSLTGKDTHWPGTRAWLEALTSSSGYCRQNIHGYGKSMANAQESQDFEDFIDNFEIDRHSPIFLKHLDLDWGTQDEVLSTLKSLEAASSNCDVSDSHCRGGETTEEETKGASTSSPALQETQEGATISSPILQETEGSTTHSSVVQETRVAYCVKKHSVKGQPSLTPSSNCVLHTYDSIHHLQDPYSPIETPPEKRIFTKTSSLPDVLHPDHDFLENDDEELEGIWNNAKKVPQVCPVQAPHSVAPKEMVGVNLLPVKQNSHREQYGQVVMGTEPNMLVATFTLPASAMLSTELVMDKSPNAWKENSQSTVKVPADCYPEEISGEKSRPNPQTPPTETLEKIPTLKVTRKLDFHLMEGPLEKKHVLQVGGKKASSRTWGTFYAVLVRKTLCFYHDHKHSTKSSASAPPLHLTGAVCSLELDYTKRDNCFRLRLMDGSEYLFRAPNLESLQQWVTKLRHNSGMEDSDLLRNAALTSDISPRIMSRSLMPDLCPPTPARAAIMVPVVNPPYWKKAENVASEIAKPNSHHQLPGRLPESDNDGDPDTNLTMRRRSQSFSSVVYQKVTPVSSPRETSSSYSVTVYIDEPLIPRGRCHSFAAPQGEWISRHTADLKPRNKSVFRKFFRKKE